MQGEDFVAEVVKGLDVTAGQLADLGDLMSNELWPSLSLVMKRTGIPPRVAKVLLRRWRKAFCSVPISVSARPSVTPVAVAFR